MDRFIAVDSGKFATKFAVATQDKDGQFSGYTTGQFRTKMCKGNFDDDEIGNNTYVCEIEDMVLKIGNAATQGTELETSKMSAVHRYCTLLAIAKNVDDGDKVYAAVCMPINEHSVVEKRLAFKNFVLPEGKVTVKYKVDRQNVVEKTFEIKERYVFPESEGGLYLDMIKNDGVAAIVDIGSLNVHASYFVDFKADMTSSMTSELGGQILINALSAELSAQFTRCSEAFVAQLLKKAPEDRYLTPTVPNKEIEEASKKLIKEFLINHVKGIRRMCDTRNWSIDYIPITFVGGTSALLSTEIKEVFGPSAYIPPRPELANVVGALRRLLSICKGVILNVA